MDKMEVCNLLQNVNTDIESIKSKNGTCSLKTKNGKEIKINFNGNAVSMENKQCLYLTKKEILAFFNDFVVDDSLRQ